MSASHELGHETDREPSLYLLAEKMCDQPGGFDRYNYAKCVWLGNPDRDERLAGRHPWPSRVKDGESYVYSVPVMAGVDVEHQKMLYVGKDNWKPVGDPNAWIVAERGLLSGEEIEHRVLTSSVDASGHLRLAIAPASYDNFPPIMQDAMRRRPAYAQVALSGRMDQRYNLRESVIREGLGGRTLQFEDITSLESMIMMIQDMRSAEQARDERISLDAAQSMGTHSMMAMACAV